MAYLSARGCASGSLFMLQDGRPLSHVLLTDWLRQIFSAAGCHGYLLAIPQAPVQLLRHQFLSSSIGDELNLTCLRLFQI